MEAELVKDLMLVKFNFYFGNCLYILYYLVICLTLFIINK